MLKEISPTGRGYPNYQMKKRIRNPELVGRQFNYWTIIDEDKPNHLGKRVVVAKCRCGTIRSVLAQNLIANKSTSCGCYQREAASKWSKQYQAQRKAQA